MANRGYDVVVDVDAGGDDLGHTDLQEDLEFHSSNFDDPTGASSRKTVPPDASTASGGGFLPTHNNNNHHHNSSGGSSKRFLWSLAFYAQFFDVDTTEVLRRCGAALRPTTRADFLDVLDGNPDLYGPFWIATTVVLILFLTGTISQYLARTGAAHFAYDFRLLSGAAGLIYGYTAAVPLALWALLRAWLVGPSAPASLLECAALYGYANLIWIPVALISWSPVTVLNYVFVGLGFACSALFLVRNLYPILNATDVRTAKILLLAVLVLHAGLAVAIKILFFAHASPLAKD